MKLNRKNQERPQKPRKRPGKASETPKKIKEEEAKPSNMDFTAVMQHSDDVFSREEVMKIINYWWEKRIDVGVFFLILYASARRVSEICGMKPFNRVPGLRPIDIKFDKGLVEFDILKKQPIKRKNKKGRSRSPETIMEMKALKKPYRLLFPLDRVAFDALIDYVKKYKIPPKERIFPFTPSRAQVFLDEACEHFGIVSSGTRKYFNRHTGEKYLVNRKPHLHMFRHSYAYHMITSKSHERNPRLYANLQYMMAHSNINMTLHYARLHPVEMQEFTNTLLGDKDV